jgi:hypothetical protein
MFVHFILLFFFQIKILVTVYKFSFILTTNIFIEKNYSREQEWDFINDTPITEIKQSINIDILYKLSYY